MGCSDAEHAPPNGAVASAEQETLSKLNEVADTTAEYVRKYPYIFHLVQKSLWEEAIATNSTYFPPTYQQDGFTHATANPKFLLTIGNHFYPQVEGDWLCLRMSVDSLVATDVKTIFEGTAPVGDKEADFAGTDSELFPHILGGIHPDAVLEAHVVNRNDQGRFLEVAGVVSDLTFYHVVGKSELASHTQDSIYTPASLQTDGYIHFSRLDGISTVANELYADRDALLALKVTFAVGDENVKWTGDSPAYQSGFDLTLASARLAFVKDEHGKWSLPSAEQ